MKNIPILLFLLLCLSNIINVYNSTLKKKFNHTTIKNKTNDGFRKRINKKIFSNRKMDENLDITPSRDGDSEVGGEETPVEGNNEGQNLPTVELDFKPLKIFIDSGELFADPDFSEGQKNIILEAAKKAKLILEDFLKIEIDQNAQLNIVSEGTNTLEENYGITHYSDLFRSDFNLLNNNYFIFLDLIDIPDTNRESVSAIIDLHNNVPYMGIVGLTKNMDESKLTLEYLTPIMLHHFIKILGFNRQIIQLYSEGEYRLDSSTFGTVINYAKDYFDCQDIESIILTYEDGEIYWPKRLLLGELMTKLDYPEERVLSGFTLAFLNDLPYLEVTKEYYTGGLMRFGKHKGCEFCIYNCNSNGYDSPTFANEFFLLSSSSTYPSCSSGRLSKTIYGTSSSPTIPVDEPGVCGKGCLRRRIEGEYEIPSDTNACPYAQFPNEENYHGSCFDKNTVINAKEGSNTAPDVLPLCYEMKCSSKSLSIKVGDYYIVCPREGGKIFAEHFNGFIMCPDYNLICTGSTMCNNLLDCYNKKSTEKEESFDYSDYSEIKTTHNQDVYKTASRDYGWELATDGVCPKFCMQCKSKTDCEKCRQGYVFLNNECIQVDNCQTFNYDEDGEQGDCNECQEGYFLAEVSSGKYCENNNNKDSYFLSNKGLHIYKRCDLAILNCQKCSSEIKCDACSDGYELQENNGISICYKKEDDDDDGLSKGAIAGIVLGSVGCAGIIFFIILLLKRKMNEKDKISNSSKKIVETAKENVKDPLEDGIKVIEFDKKSENMDVTAKRMAPKDKNIY